MASSNDMERYRREQEAFVSNHGGTTSLEVVYILLPNICSILLTATTIGILRKCVDKNLKTLIEFFLIIIPSILCCTVLSDHAISICIGMVLISAINVILITTRKSLSEYNGPEFKWERRPFLTNFRALTNIITVICVLAVDFRIFPRKFAKTEVHGYSLMDTGVGLFVLANALVAPEARNLNEVRKTGFWKTFSRNIKNSSRSCTLLLILGFSRFLAIEYIGYQKHVTEYGVHWNFFITLAVVKLFTSTFTSTINSKYAFLSGIWILAMHEYILNTKGVKEWVLSDIPRVDFVTANREGLVSVPGYIGLYLLGVGIGRLIHTSSENMSIKNALHQSQTSFCIKIFGYECVGSYNESMILCVKLSLIAMQACAATLFCDSKFRVSRRLGNAGYCMWILTLTVMGLTLLLLVEIAIDILMYATMTQTVPQKPNKEHKTGRKNKSENVHTKNMEVHFGNSIELFEAVNYNGLFFFLLGNIMTGSINICIYTLYVTKLTAILILIAYMAINLLCVVILYRRKIQIKI